MGLLQMKLKANYNEERKYKYGNSLSVTHNIPISKLLMRLECHNLLFCKREYEYVFYGVRLIRMTKKT